MTRCLASMMSRTAVRTTFTNHMLNTTWYQHRPQDRASHKASSCIQLVHLRTCSRKWTSPKMTVSCSTLGVMRLWRLTQTATQSMTLRRLLQPWKPSILTYWRRYGRSYFLRVYRTRKGIVWLNWWLSFAAWWRAIVLCQRKSHCGWGYYDDGTVRRKRRVLQKWRRVVSRYDRCWW